MALLVGPTLYGAAVNADRCEALDWLRRAAAQGSVIRPPAAIPGSWLRSAPNGNEACAAGFSPRSCAISCRTCAGNSALAGTDHQVAHRPGVGQRDPPDPGGAQARRVRRSAARSRCRCRHRPSGRPNRGRGPARDRRPPARRRACRVTRCLLRTCRRRARRTGRRRRRRRRRSSGGERMPRGTTRASGSARKAKDSSPSRSDASRRRRSRRCRCGSRRRSGRWSVPRDRPRCPDARRGMSRSLPAGVR